MIHRSPSVGSDNSKTESDNLPNSEWSQVESIDLINDGTGLGFGIVGMRNMGVVVKTILPGGVADRDGRLQSGDHILQVSYHLIIFLLQMWETFIIHFKFLQVFNQFFKLNW